MGSGYVSLAQDRARFYVVQHPMDLKLERMNDHVGIESTLLRHKAGWHKSCRLKFNKRAYDVSSKSLSKSTEHQDNSCYVHTRSTHRCPQSTEHVCLFCENPATPSSSLHNASTYKIDAKVQEYVIALEAYVLRTLLCRLNFQEVT